MKHLTLLLIVSVAFLSSCKEKPCVDKKPCSDDKTCYEKPASTEPCEAAFERWFYDSKTNECYKKAYSGCEIYGFASEEECEKCECNDKNDTRH